jgi:hypothetical protein
MGLNSPSEKRVFTIGYIMAGSMTGLLVLVAGLSRVIGDGRGKSE